MIRILAVAHDPGGANAVAATTAALRAQGVHVTAIAKGPARDQFRRLAVECSAFYADAVATVLSSGIHLMLTGTSEVDLFEREAITAARATDIPSVAVVDYWMKHRERFGAHGGAWILPDHLIAIDEHCRRQMIVEGLPAARIHTLGQPYFSVLLARAGRSDAGTAPVRRLLFASEPGPLTTKALDFVLDALALLPDPVGLTIRFHTRETERTERLARIARAGCPVSVDESFDPLETARTCDAVIGVTSMILIETSLLGVPTAAFGGDVRALADYRLCVPLSSARDVAAFLRSPRLSAPDPEFLAGQRGAAERVAAFCIAVSRGSRAAALDGVTR